MLYEGMLRVKNDLSKDKESDSLIYCLPFEPPCSSSLLQLVDIVHANYNRYYWTTTWVVSPG